jgi:xylulokinase
MECLLCLTTVGWSASSLCPDSSMPRDLLVSIDVGSSGVRASAFSTGGELVALGRSSYPTAYPSSGHVEQDALSYVSATEESLRAMMSLLGKDDQVVAIGLTGQCPTYVPVDADGRPVGMAWTYQDNRSEAEALLLRERFGNDTMHHMTGQSVFAFYILPKMLWHRLHQPESYAQVAHVLQPRDFVALYLTGELVTEETHANSSLLYDLRKHQWNTPFMQQLGVDPSLMPARVLHAWERVGSLREHVAQTVGLPVGIPVIIGAADSQCCSLGAGAVDPGVISEMSGTSTCLNCSVAQPSDDARVAVFAHVIPDMWSLELGINTSGACFDWVTSLLYGGDGRFERAEKELSHFTVTEETPTFLPYLAGGERDDPSLQGGFHGLLLQHGRVELAYAVLEGVAFAMRAKIDILRSAGGIDRVVVSGGGAASRVWNQVKANVLGMPIEAVSGLDAAELGAAMLAGIGAGVYTDYRQAIAQCSVSSLQITPEPSLRELCDRRYKVFRDLQGTGSSWGQDMRPLARKGETYGV